MINDFFELIGLKRSWCKFSDGRVYSSRYKRGKIPFPKENLKSLRLISFFEHGMQQSYLMFKYSDSKSEISGTDHTLSDEMLGFDKTFDEVAFLYDIPDNVITEFQTHKTELTIVHLVDGKISQITNEL